MEKDNKIFLEHIFESINKIEEAVVRNLEIIGEAARNLADSFKTANSHIAWRDITDFRNVLIHEYFGVNKDLVWQVIKKDLPKLKKEIKILLK